MNESTLMIKKVAEMFNKSISTFAPMELNLVRAVWHATEGNPQRAASLPVGVQIAINNL